MNAIRRLLWRERRSLRICLLLLSCVVAGAVTIAAARPTVYDQQQLVCLGECACVWTEMKASRATHKKKKWRCGHQRKNGRAANNDTRTYIMYIYVLTDELSHGIRTYMAG